MSGEHWCKSFTHLVEDTEHQGQAKETDISIWVKHLLPDQALEKTASEQSHVPERMKAYQRSVMENKTIPLWVIPLTQPSKQ